MSDVPFEKPQDDAERKRQYEKDKERVDIAADKAAQKFVNDLYARTQNAARRNEIAQIVLRHGKANLRAVVTMMEVQQWAWVKNVSDNPPGASHSVRRFVTSKIEEIVEEEIYQSKGNADLENSLWLRARRRIEEMLREEVKLQERGY